jgi:hypothetical protein
MLGVTSDWATCSVRFAPHPRQKIKKEKVALVAVVFMNLPKLHPKGIKLANLKTLRRVTEVERYKEKAVTTVTQSGKCVFHFRVSDAESLKRQAQIRLYAERAQVGQMIRGVK